MAVRSSGRSQSISPVNTSASTRSRLGYAMMDLAEVPRREVTVGGTWRWQAVERRRHDRLWRLVTERAERRAFSGWAGVVCDLITEVVDVDAAAVSIRSSERSQELVAATDEWAASLEELQYTVGEGPGVQAFADGSPVLVSDVVTAQSRWPGFVGGAVAAGLAAVFALPVQGGAIRLGTLDLYRRRTGRLSPEHLADAAVLADLVVTALLADVGDGTPAAEWVRMSTAGHYDDLNVATGMLAAGLRITLDDAFLRLRARAYSHGVPLLDVARAVLARRLDADAFQE